MKLVIWYKMRDPRDWDHKRDHLKIRSQTHTKVLVCPTMINLSLKRLLYITLIVPLLLAMLVGAHDDPPAKRQQGDTVTTTLIPRTLAA